MESVNTLVYMAKKDFANRIMLRILRWGDYSGLSGWVQHNQSQGSLYEGERDVIMEAEVGVVYCLPGP